MVTKWNKYLSAGVGKEHAQKDLFLHKDSSYGIYTPVNRLTL